MSLDPRRFVHNEHVNTDWTITVEPGVSLSDIANPAFLANVAGKLQPYDQIRVRIDTGEWYALLLVVDCSRTYAKTVVLYQKDLVKAEDSTDVDDNYIMKNLGPHRKWCVIRKSDKAAIKEECVTRQDAALWLQQYLLTM